MIGKSLRILLGVFFMMCSLYVGVYFAAEVLKTGGFENMSLSIITILYGFVSVSLMTFVPSMICSHIIFKD